MCIVRGGEWINIDRSDAFYRHNRIGRFETRGVMAVVKYLSPDSADLK